MKRKDKRPKHESSANHPARPQARPNQHERRGDGRGPAQHPARGEHKSPSNPKRKARRTGRKREPAEARPGEPRVQLTRPPFNTPPPVLDERIEEASLNDGDIDSEEAFELGIGSRVIPPTTQYGEAYDSTPPEPAERKSGDVEAQIRALEARLDGLIRQRHFAEPASDAPNSEPVPETRAVLAKAESSPPAKLESA
ncbi:MAG TPA: hypothetical protein VFK05_19145, partial [Polyangiaceae bacterium]|nr:hypothetical protein [Polyangiaceae bacterium]